MNIKDLLNVSWKCPDCDDMKVVFTNPSLIGVTLQINNFEITLGNRYRLGNYYTFRPNNDVPVGTIDSITIDYTDGIPTTFSSCPLTLIACGDNCEKCDSNSCLDCSPNFAHYETPLSHHCVSKSEYNNKENFVYIPEGNYFAKCYDSCKTCYKSGTNSYNNCNQCKENYFLFK